MKVTIRPEEKEALIRLIESRRYILERYDLPAREREDLERLERLRRRLGRLVPVASA